MNQIRNPLQAYGEPLDPLGALRCFTHLCSRAAMSARVRPAPVSMDPSRVSPTLQLMSWAPACVSRGYRPR